MDTTTQMKFIYTGIFFLFIFLSGFWVSRSGKPYNGFIFNIHKFIGLGMGAFLILTVYRLNSAASLGVEQWLAISGTVLLFIVNVAAGGLLSVRADGGLSKMPPTGQIVIQRVHQLMPYVIALATSALLYFLLIPN